jgi:L-ascorbate metabolism protein UlaG (beta-lactamase superfamily)
MKLTYFGHSCFLIQTIGKAILTDPFITGNELARGLVDVQSIKCDYLLISHAHIDHVADVELILKNNPEATLISNYEIAAHYHAATGCKWHPMNTGGTFQFDFGQLRCTIAEHSSSFQDGKYGGCANGYVISNTEGALYFAGDTGLTLDMQLLPVVAPKLTAAILPIGGNFTMNMYDAVISAQYINCDQIFGCHFDTFGWIKMDHAEAWRTFGEAGKTLTIPEIGESYVI